MPPSRSGPDGGADAPSARQATAVGAGLRSRGEIAAYGAQAQALLRPAGTTLNRAAAKAANHVESLFLADAKGGEVVRLIERENLSNWTASSRSHLRAICSPALTEHRHKRMARDIGRTFELLGLPLSLAVEGMWLALRTLHREVADLPWPREHQTALASILTARMRVELKAEIDGQHELWVMRDQLIVGLEQWRTECASWTEFVGEAMGRLSNHPGIIAATVGRPDSDAQFVFEFMSPGFSPYWAEIRRRRIGPLSMDAGSAFGQSPQARAWRSRSIETNPSYMIDPGAGPWWPAAHVAGIHSSAALPIDDIDGEPAAMLALYGALPGQFETQTMRLFLQALRQVFSQAFMELGRRSRPVILPAEVRQRQLQLLNRGAVQMLYQPIVDLATGKPSMVEALARLEPAGGPLVEPAAFLAGFGRTELNRLFVLGLRMALRQLAAWDSEGLNLALTLNLPPSVLVHSDCMRWVRNSLDETGIAPQRLSLELLEDQETSAATLRDTAIDQLATLGVKLVMDDFGSGYSNLWRLRSLPFDAVKFDRQMLTELQADQPRMVRFLAALMNVVRGLDLRVVIEGLESPALVELACSLEADAGQGYALSPPLTAALLPAWIRDFTWQPINRAQPQSTSGAAAAEVGHPEPGHAPGHGSRLGKR